jgi:transposase-like protein
MNERKLNKNRKFSEQIRRKVVKEFRSGKYTVIELSELYHCSDVTIYRWIHKYSPGDSPQVNVVEMSKSADQKVKDLKQKIADLERALGQKQIKVDFYEKILALAEEQYDLDLKKSSSSRPSSGSGRTKR